MSREATEARLAEANRALAESERLLHAIIDAEFECIKLVRPDGTIAMMNPAGVTMCEAASQAEVIGVAWEAVVAPEHKDAVRQAIRAGFAGEQRRFEFELIGLRGGRRWMDSSVAPLRDERGEIVSLVSVARDMTPQ